jgi:Zn-dependent protease
VRPPSGRTRPPLSNGFGDGRNRKCLLIALVLSSLAVETIVIAVHEVGHACAARALGYPATFRVRGVKLLGRRVWLMPVARIDFGATMPSRSVDIIVALAGPVASISLGLALLQLPGSLCWSAAVASLFIGFASLLPFRWFDGQHIWHAVEQREFRMVVRSSSGVRREGLPLGIGS